MTHGFRCILAAALILLTAGFLLLWFQGRPVARPSSGDYAAVTGPCSLRFPRDHGSHPDYKTEWWYYTGNLRDQDGRPFGYQLTFFRSRIIPPHEEADTPQPASAWRTPQIFLAHAALSDIGGKTFSHNERIARGTLDMAGAATETEGTRIFLRDWSVTIGETAHRLTASSPDFEIELTATPLKPPVPHGEGGYSRKGAKRESASCYYSFTRLATTGTVRSGAERFTVEGLSWMDHEFSSDPLEDDLVGWDWFSLQLEDDSELMLYFLRQETGGFSPASSATFVPATGAPVHLSAGQIALQVTDTWKSPATGAVYPAGWRLRVRPLSLDLAITPRMADQEMETPESTDVTYWEGSIAVSGKKAGGTPVSGTGYVEMTGYETEFDAPM